MKTTFLCPGCQARVSADDSYIGRNVRCPKCSAKFILSRENLAPPSSETSAKTGISAKAEAATASSGEPAAPKKPAPANADDIDAMIGNIQTELKQEALAAQKQRSSSFGAGSARTPSVSGLSVSSASSPTSSS